MSDHASPASPVGGCLALIAGLIAIAMIAMAIISLAAVLDPFSWMPTAGQIWEDCHGDCALAHRFPGFWWHAVANLLYAAATVAAAVLFGGRVVELRRTRAARHDGVAALADYHATRHACRQTGAALAGLALLPIAAAVL